MQTLTQVLQVGGRSNSLGRSAEVLDVVRRDPGRLPELLACTRHDDAWVRMRAMDVLEKLCRDRPELVEPHVPELLATLTVSPQASVQWHLAQVLRQVRLTPEQQEQAVAWLESRVATTDVDWIAAVEAMRTLLVLAEAGVVPAEEVAALVEVQRTHRSAAVRRKADAFLAHLRAATGWEPPD